MALIYSQVPCEAAGTFTTNVVKAAPVKWDRQVIDSGKKAQAVIVNSGIANACTGAEGFGYCKDTAEAAAKYLSVDAEGVLIGSTGVIGKQNDSIENGTEAAKAIMTTDTHEKELAVTIQVGGKTVTIGGMAKGSGMIHPNMATMLSFITTDISISPSLLKEALKESVNISYNRISVDCDSSTNDMVLIMANGLASNETITEKNDDYNLFLEALTTLNIYISKKIAKDGEGATKLIECTVKNALSIEDAETLSKSVVTSSLVKAAMFGSDANWGRILCALGYSNIDFDPEKVDVSFASETGTILVCKAGSPVNFDEKKAKEILLQNEVKILVNMNLGSSEVTTWGCDLTYDYVKINGDYRS